MRYTHKDRINTKVQNTEYLMSSKRRYFPFPTIRLSFTIIVFTLK